METETKKIVGRGSIRRTTSGMLRLIAGYRSSESGSKHRKTPAFKPHQTTSTGVGEPCFEAIQLSTNRNIHLPSANLFQPVRGGFRRHSTHCQPQFFFEIQCKHRHYARSLL